MQQLCIQAVIAQAQGTFHVLQAGTSASTESTRGINKEIHVQFSLTNLALSGGCLMPMRWCIAEAGTGALWQRTASQVLASETIPKAADGPAVQARLRRQAHALRTLLSGALACLFKLPAWDHLASPSFR